MVRVNTRDEILRVAAGMFTRVGFKGTSLQDIADEVGCSKAALLYHFAGKEQILLALISEAEQAFAALVAELTVLDDAAVQAAAIEGFIDLVLVHRRAATLLYDVMPQFKEHPGFAEVLKMADVLCAAIIARSTEPADQIAAAMVLQGIVSVAIDDERDAAELRPALLRVTRRALIHPLDKD